MIIYITFTSSFNGYDKSSERVIFMPMLFGDLFDLNRDGKLDPVEQGMEFMLLDELMNEKDDAGESEKDEEDE